MARFFVNKFFFNSINKPSKQRGVHMSNQLYELNRFNFSPDQNAVLSSGAVKSASAAIKIWRQRAKLSETPLVISLDCVVDRSDKVKVLSVERNPLGIELLKLHRPDFLKTLGRASLDKTGRKNNLQAFVNQAGYSTCFPDHPGHIIQEQFAGIIPAEEPSLDLNHNRYGQDWLWRMVDHRSCGDMVDFDAGFCLKAINQRKVYVCPPKEQRSVLRKKNVGGRRTVSQMLRVLKELEPMYCQPFIDPLRSPDGRPMIYSLYFIYNHNINSYVYSGGLSIARNHLNVVLYGDNVTFGIID